MPDTKRADARRNVSALLDAAKVVFSEVGVDAPAKQITDRAGLGVGTLYRHFPRRSDLVVAVLEHEIDRCAHAAAQLSTDPWTALVQWIAQLTALVSAKRGLADALHSGDPAFAELPSYFFGALEPAAAALFVDARDSGDLRADISPHDLLLTISLLCHPIAGQSLDFNHQMVRIFVDGLRSHTRPTPMPAGA